MKFHDFSPFYRSGEGIRSKVSGDRLIDNPAVADAQGGSGASFNFDGDGDHVEVSDDADIDVGTADFSIEMWVKPENITQTGKYLINKEAGGIGYGLRIDTDDLYLRLDDNTTDISATIASNVFVAGSWTHLLVTCNRDGDATAYADGVSQGTVTISTASATLDNSGALRIGTETSGTTNEFAGSVSQARLHNRALSAAEVRAAYNGQAVPYEYVGGKQDEQTSGTLTIGKSYRLKDWITSDDFTNVGAASNADGVEFTATGTTPTTWSNSSKVVQIGCVAEYLPSGINATQWVDTSGNNLHGTTSTATAVNHEVGAITATGVVEVNNGIKFPATAVASADANTLDDYEEGLHTVVATMSGSGTVTIGTAYDDVSYTKIGRRVFVNGSLSVLSVSSPVGTLELTLPFQAAAGAGTGYDVRSGTGIGTSSVDFNAGTAPMIYVSNGATKAEIRVSGDNIGLDGVVPAASDVYYLNFSYLV